MSILNHLAQAAAILLLFELFILLIIFVAISFGLGFGVHWARGKGRSVYPTVNDYTEKGAGYVHTGTEYASKPIIVVAGTAERVKGTLDAIRRQARRVHRVAQQEQPEAETPPIEPLV